MKTDLELISDEVFDMWPTSVRLIETRKCKDGEHRLYEVRAEVCLGGETDQAIVRVCVTDWSSGHTSASRMGHRLDHANPITQERTA